MPRANPIRIWYFEKEPIEVRINPAAQVKAEEEFGVPLSKMDTMKQNYYMAWLAATRQGKENLSFEDFLDAVMDIEEVIPEESQSLGPTSEAQSRDSS
jgi:hypothetical protein